MSAFVDVLMAHYAPDSPTRSDRGMTTGEPTQPRRTTWTEVHRKALRAAGSLIGTAEPGLQYGDAVAVLAGDPALIDPAVQGVWLAGGNVTMLHQPTPGADLAVGRSTPSSVGAPRVVRSCPLCPAITLGLVHLFLRGGQPPGKQLLHDVGAAVHQQT